MKKVLFVCLGNICRSPLAEGVFLHLIKEQKLERKFVADSAGTVALHAGEQPDARTLQVTKNHHIAIEHHARQFSENDLVDFDYIFLMDETNFKDIKKVQKAFLSNNPDQQTKAKLFLLREFDTEGETFDVPDPYYGTASDFEECYQTIERCNKEIINFLKKA